MISARASSTTLRVLLNGALNTAMPRAAAAIRSIWLVPMQKAPMASSSSASARTSSVTWVPERMPSRSASATSFFSSSVVAARSHTSTSQPASASSWAATGWIDLEKDGAHDL